MANSTPDFKSMGVQSPSVAPADGSAAGSGTGGLTAPPAGDRSSNPMNVGHGHVFPRPDGVKARCDGPGFCALCSADLARKQASESQKNPQQAPDRFRTVEGHTFTLLACRLCGSPAELWQRWLRDDIWHSFGACTNLEDLDGEPCLFHLPDSESFYRARKADAVKYWNLMMGPRRADETKASLGPREPRNDMVICPNCTYQFGAISVDDQMERYKLRTALEQIAKLDEHGGYNTACDVARAALKASACRCDEGPAVYCPMHAEREW